MALGAKQGDIVRLMMREGALVVMIGLAAGWMASLGASRLLESLLFGVTPTELSVYAGVALAFYLVLKDGEHTEVVTLGTEKLVVEKGRREPEKTYSFDRTWANVRLKQSKNRWYPSKLLIGSHGRYVEVGGFLSEGERKSLAKMLINVLAKNR